MEASGNGLSPWRRFPPFDLIDDFIPLFFFKFELRWNWLKWKNFRLLDSGKLASLSSGTGNIHVIGSLQSDMKHDSRGGFLILFSLSLLSFIKFICCETEAHRERGRGGGGFKLGGGRKCWFDSWRGLYSEMHSQIRKCHFLFLFLLPS